MNATNSTTTGTPATALQNHESTDCARELAASRLALALARFNERFDYHLALPIWPETVEAAAVLSECHNREDLAADLRAALQEECA